VRLLVEESDGRWVAMPPGTSIEDDSGMHREAG
jgi:hypothetical protein